MKITNMDAEQKNLQFWDEVAPVHYKAYDIESLLKGRSLIDEVQKKDFYPIKSKDLLHLQCHIGTDTLSLAMDGANVTGVDFSEESIKTARKLQKRLNLQAEFICSNIYDLKEKITKKFDIVYTSKGVLAWLRDIEKWGEIISYLLRENGVFYILDIHAVKLMFDDTIENELIIKNSYFHRNEPTMWGDDDYPDYADKSYIPKNYTYEWTWSLSDIINALINNGLVIEKVREFDKLFYDGLPGMKKDENGWWYIENYEGKIPFSFSIRAKKPGK